MIDAAVKSSGESHHDDATSVVYLINSVVS